MSVELYERDDYEPSGDDLAFMRAEDERFDARPEEQAAYLNKGSDQADSATSWTVEDGRYVRDRAGTQAERDARAVALWRKVRHTRQRRRVVERVHGFRSLAPRTNPRPRESRRRRVLRIRRASSSASRDGPGEPEPPLSAPGSAGLVGSEVAG